MLEQHVMGRSVEMRSPLCRPQDVVVMQDTIEIEVDNSWTMLFCRWIVRGGAARAHLCRSL